MFGSCPQTLWLSVTNLALAVVILAAAPIVAGDVGWELVVKPRRARQSVDLDAELSSILAAASHQSYNCRLGTDDGGRRHAGKARGRIGRGRR
jgi:hypothetical protein